VTVIAPALGNAISNACGARIRSLPITAEAVKAAMTAWRHAAVKPEKADPPERSSGGFFHSNFQ
jgi:hypothetical protein